MGESTTTFKEGFSRVRLVPAERVYSILLIVGNIPGLREPTEGGADCLSGFTWIVPPVLVMKGHATGTVWGN